MKNYLPLLSSLLKQSGATSKDLCNYMRQYDGDNKNLLQKAYFLASNFNGCWMVYSFVEWRVILVSSYSMAEDYYNNNTNYEIHFLDNNYVEQMLDRTLEELNVR